MKAAPFHVLLLLASNRLFVGIVTELGQQVARIGRQARAVREVVAQGRVLRCIYGTASAVSGKNVRTGAFQETTPRSTRAPTAVAAMNLLIEASWNRVFSSTASVAPLRRMPYPFTNTVSFAFAITTVAPGTP